MASLILESSQFFLFYFFSMIFRWTQRSRFAPAWAYAVCAGLRSELCICLTVTSVSCANIQRKKVNPDQNLFIFRTTLLRICSEHYKCQIVTDVSSAPWTNYLYWICTPGNGGKNNLFFILLWSWTPFLWSFLQCGKRRIWLNPIAQGMRYCFPQWNPVDFLRRNEIAKTIQIARDVTLNDVWTFFLFLL